MKKDYIKLAIAFAAGVILANKVRTLPGLNKLPTL